jgi:SP family facilitated glucose transporter-like MFS transporter 3
VPLKGVGGFPHTTMAPARRSMHEMSNLVEDGSMFKGSSSSSDMLGKSYTVNADGSMSYQTALQMSRHELYESIPFTAVFGLQKRERSLSMAVSSYAADLDVIEADQQSFAKSQTHLSSYELAARHSQASLMLLEELELDNVMVTTPLIFAVMVAAMGQFLVGYNIGVMNAPSTVVFPDHSTAEWSLAVAAFCFGGPFGANYAGMLAESRGRRGALLICTWTFLLGGIFQTASVNMYCIIASRFIIGLASGMSTVIVPIYLGELAPPTLRGTLGTLTQFALVVGILISDCFAFAFATHDKWRILFAVTGIVALLQLLCAPWLLESPRWLLSKKPDSKKARYIIKKLRGLRYDHEVSTEVDHFIGAMDSQDVKDGGGHKTMGFADMIADKNIRVLVVSCFVLQGVQQLCGINAVFYYSTSFFEGVIPNPLIGTTLVGGVNVIATYAALLLMDSSGRRTLLLWSMAGMLISCFVIMASLLEYFSNITALVAVNFYVIFFEIGLGPIPWLIVAEMFDAKYVATAMSTSSQINWFFNFVVGLVFPYLNEYLGPYSFAPFATVLLFGFIFTAIWLPETQGTTPQELQAKLIKKNESVVYHNMSFVGDRVGGDDGQQGTLGDEWRIAMDQVRKEEEDAMYSGNFNYGFKPIYKKIEEEEPAPATGGFMAGAF